MKCILPFNPISYTDNNEESAFENTDWIANLEKFEELAYTRARLVLVTPFLYFTFDDELKQTQAKNNIKVNIRHNFMPLCVILHGWWYLSSCMKMQRSRRLLNHLLAQSKLVPFMYYNNMIRSIKQTRGRGIAIKCRQPHLPL